MLIILIITILILWAAIVWWLYSNFMTFYSNFNEIQNYNKAYYASISALERAELAIKDHHPWFEGKWWRTIDWDVRNDTDKQPDNFSYFSKWNSSKTSLNWDITSLTKRIPTQWNGNVDFLLSYYCKENCDEPDDNSNNYNILGYNNSEIFLLYKDDNTTTNYGKWVTADIKFDTESKITGRIRLPKLLNFGTLNVSEKIQWSNVKDDSIVDWQIKWTTKNNSPFTIYSTQSISRLKWDVNKEYDSVIRESVINNMTTNKNNFLNFLSSSKNPIINPNIEDKVESIIISNDENSLKSLSIWRIIQDTSQTSIRLSLLNLLKSSTTNKTSGNNKTPDYPFLEYYMDFWNTPVPDKYFTIDAEWAYWDFQINTIIKKPTTHEATFWNFTVIL